MKKSIASDAIVEPCQEKIHERKSYLDVAKLLCVMLVAYCHTTSSYTWVNEITDCFFMPAFFFYYGTAVRERHVSFKEIPTFLLKKVKALLVPYMLWALIYSTRLDWTFLKNVLYGTNPSLGAAGTHMVLWFIPTMFTATILYQIYSNIYIYIGKTKRFQTFLGGRLPGCSSLHVIGLTEAE